jgi:NAD(P)-dependent dehydrogenase (short-subunit alcohol dehydrogenase family)
MMLLENKNAVVYGGGGSVGGAVARAFAREGARVFLGRSAPNIRRGAFGPNPGVRRGTRRRP